MNKIEFFKKQLKKKWYVQGFNAIPIFLNSSAISGFKMKPIVGLAYSQFLFKYKDNWGEMHYLESDLKNLWLKTKELLNKNPIYLKNIEKKFYEISDDHERFFLTISQKELDQISEEELIAYFHRCHQAQVDAVGIAHIVDPIGVGIEEEFKSSLKKVIKDPKIFNQDSIILTTPPKLSFITQEERDLYQVSIAPKNKIPKQLEQHFQKYFWIQNSFGVPKDLTVESFAKRIKKGIKEPALPKIAEKQRLIKELKLSKEIRGMIALIDFSTIWQDNRKKCVLKSTGYFIKVIEEISWRTKIDEKLLFYLSNNEIDRIKKLEDFSQYQEELGQRINGVFFSLEPNQEISLSGQEYQQLLQELKEGQKLLSEEELHGSIANPGKAIGPAKICKNVESIKKVRKDDVLVASMTRPEYMPAVKKAAAIVTDEGGITCHAAIVSREMNIPCIVGTKIATKIFKDGDILEVRANHGVVRKIK